MDARNPPLVKSFAN